MGIFEAESLPSSARQIEQVGVNKQDNNIIGGDIDKRNMPKPFCFEETASFCHGGGWDYIERRLK